MKSYLKEIKNILRDHGSPAYPSVGDIVVGVGRQAGIGQFIEKAIVESIADRKASLRAIVRYYISGEGIPNRKWEYRAERDIIHGVELDIFRISVIDRLYDN